MFFSNSYVESERQRMPQCEESDILRELLLDGDFASPRLPLPSSTRHLGLNKRPHHLELSLPQISFESVLTPLGRFPTPNAFQSRLPHPLSDRHSLGASNSNGSNANNNNSSSNTSNASYYMSAQSPSLPSSIMNAIISPPRVFIQEFGRLPPPFFHDGLSNMLDSDSMQDARPVKSVPPLVSCLPPPPLPMLSMPPLKKKKVSNNSTSTKSSGFSSSSSSAASSASSSPSGVDSAAGEDRKQQRCSHPDCPNLRRSAGFCNRHSGKVCSVAGCNKSALSRGKCPEHGGGSRCKRDGCQKFAQTRGLCKSHGGGRECNVPGCNKNAHQNRLCRSHGGGKRCDFYGCPKWAQRSGYCCAHTKMGHHASGGSSVSGLRALSTTGLSMAPPILSPPLMSPHRLLSLLP